MKKTPLLLLVFVFACQSVPIVRESDTSEQRQSIESTAERLHTLPTDSTIGPRDGAVIIAAEDQLKACAASLEMQDGKIRICVDSLKSVSGRLEKCEAQTGILAKLESFGSALKWVLLASIGAYAAGAFTVLAGPKILAFGIKILARQA